MPLKDILKKIVGVAAPPPFAHESDERKASILYFLLLLLLAAFMLLIVLPLREEPRQVRYALYIAADTVLLGLILARLGKIAFASSLVSFGLLIVEVYILINREGARDISILGLPVIIALGGLLLGKRGSLALTGLTIIGYGTVVWVEMRGLLPNAEVLTRKSGISDLVIASVLLVTTSVLIYFIKESLSSNLNRLRKNEKALQEANESLLHNSTLMERRANQLFTGAEVSQAASTILEPDELCQKVVDMVHDRFDLYFVGLFLVDDSKKWADLFAATGQAGKAMLKEGHRLQTGSTSMIGWCIANRKARLAFDVGNDPVRLDNPLLPETRSELALPLISRGEAIGAITLQSRVEKAFSEEDITTFQSMADQLANAISNARLYHRLEKELSERKRVEMEIRNLNAKLETRVAERTRELQAANEELSALSRLKDEFLANVSHELRTPLTSIKLYHSILEKNPKDVSGHINHLRRETDRLSRLIEDLLFLSRLDQGYVPFNPVELDLNKLTQEYVGDRLAMAEERQLSIKLEKQEQIPPALADEQMAGQVLSVILTNALNYTPSGGCITVSTCMENNQGRQWSGFAVRDTGPGISTQEQERLFDRFFRGTSGRSSSSPGTGLGLSIAREIVTRHGGRIDIESQGIPGKGATFVVWLPAFA